MDDYWAKNMKVGIITYTHGTNFGQRLQNYALQTVLEKKGLRVKTIKQTNPYGNMYLIKQVLVTPIIWIKDFTHEKNKTIRWIKFYKFNKEYIKFYSRKLRFRGDNKWISTKFDKFIVGSDQIWSPISDYVSDNAFLAFANSYQKMTYVPSLSVNNLDEKKIDYYRNMIEDFPFISVREHRGAEILHSISDKEIRVLVDPTFLIDVNEWNRIRKKCKKKPTQPYLLAVFLGDYPEKEIEKANEVLNLVIMYINELTEMSPDEFLDAIADAEMVLTDSYHATIFSCIYHVPFINFSRSNYGETMNSRFETLYRLLGIDSRYWDDLRNNLASVYSIDFNSIDKRINDQRRYSSEFIDLELEYTE